VLGDGTPVTVDPSMIQVVEESREGWTVATEGGVSVALDLTVDDVLRREGLARELIRTINDQRKQLDLQLSDRIRLELAIDGQLERAVADHRETICRETVEVGGHAARIRIEVNR
jgi:isoleucyl-tRNA synthetase